MRMNISAKIQCFHYYISICVIAVNYFEVWSKNLKRRDAHVYQLFPYVSEAE